MSYGRACQRGRPTETGQLSTAWRSTARLRGCKSGVAHRGAWRISSRHRGNVASLYTSTRPPVGCKNNSCNYASAREAAHAAAPHVSGPNAGRRCGAPKCPLGAGKLCGLQMRPRQRLSDAKLILFFLRITPLQSRSTCDDYAVEPERPQVAMEAQLRRHQKNQVDQQAQRGAQPACGRSNSTTAAGDSGLSHQVKKVLRSTGEMPPATGRR